MEKKTFMQKLKNMGPAAIITSAFIGPGTITTATLVGVKFQYALLWAVVFSGIALIVLMEIRHRFSQECHRCSHRPEARKPRLAPVCPDICRLSRRYLLLRVPVWQ